MRNGKAFTLIEMIVVLAIMGLMMGMSIPYFARFTRGIKLKSAASNISTVLHTARSYAVTERKNFLVIINDEIDKENDLYYAVKIYDFDKKETAGKWYQLQRGVEIAEIQKDIKENPVAVPFPNDSDASQSKCVIEYKPNGGVKRGGSIWIKDTDENYKQININEITGRVKITNDEPE